MASPVSATNYCNECDIDNHWISPTPVYFVMTRTWDQIIWIDTCRCITAPDRPASIRFVLDITGSNSSCTVQTCLTSLQMWRQVEWTKMRSGDCTTTWRYRVVAIGSQLVESVRETTVNVLSVCRVCTTDLPRKCQFGSDDSAIFWRVLTTSSQNWTGKCYYKVE